MQRLFDYLEKQPKPRLVAASGIFIVLLGLLDTVIGSNLTIFPLYLVPVFLGTWFIGKWAGVTMSVLSALSWSLADFGFEHSIILYWNVFSEAALFLVITYLLSLLKGYREREQGMARTDVLTGAVNKKSFKELADTEITRMNRFHRPFTTAYMDVDNFKAINDALGHEAGDALLRLIVKTIQDNTRATDIVARMGEDEFMFLFPETGYEMSQTTVDKIKRRLNAMAQENKYSVTFSFGMVTYQEPPPSVDSMLKLADDVLSKGKAKGKDTIHHEVFVRGVLISS
jgi:diguanylate cyclase (GGDEF)-like protein